MNSRALVTLALIVALVALAPDFAADSYVIPPDYAVASLDVETGELLWETRPPLLDRPKITVAGGVVIAEYERVIPPSAEAIEKWRSEGFSPDEYGKLFRKERQEVFFGTDGEILKGELEPAADAIGPLEPLSRNLTAADGTVFLYDSGNTRHLEALDGKATRVVRELAGFPYDLNIAGNLAIFSLAGNNGRLRGGEVVAYDLRREALRWQFESWRHVGPPVHGLTDVAVDEDRVLVAVDQVIFALDLDSGALLWTTELPRQQIRNWSNPWTSFGRVGQRLFIQCYEDLFVLERDDGALRWSFDPGPFGEAWPTIADGRVYLATREQPAEPVSMTLGGGLTAQAPPSLVRVSPSGGFSRRFALELVTTDSMPADTVAWSTLNATPPPPVGSESIVVELVDETEGGLVLRIEISGILASEGMAFVKLADFTDRVALRVDDKRAAELVINPRAQDSAPSSLPVRAFYVGFLILVLVGTAVMIASVRAQRASLALFRYQALWKPYRRSISRPNIASFLLLLTLGLIGLAVLFRAGLDPDRFVMAVTVLMLGAWVSVMFAANWTGLIGNCQLRLATREAMADLSLPANSVFVGVFEPDRKTAFNQLVDTHDDFGFLYFNEEKLIFEGSRYRREIALCSIVDFNAPLVWQFSLLGARWLEIVYSHHGESKKLRIESREHQTIRANHRATRELDKTLAALALPRLRSGSMGFSY